MIKAINILRMVVIVVLMMTTLLYVDTRWTAHDMYIYQGIAILFIIGTVVHIIQKQKLRITVIDAVVTLWFIYYVFRAWLGNEWPCRMEFLKTAGLYVLYFMLRLLLDRTELSSKYLIFIITVCGSIEAMLGIGQFCVNTSNNLPFQHFGSFLNPGPYSAYLMIGIVLCIAAMNNFQGNVKIFTTILLFLMAIVLPFTFSRAAFLGLGVFLLLLYKNKYWRYRYILLLSLFVGCTAIYFLKQGSANGRMIIWEVSLSSWLSHPLFGVGIGGFFNTFAEGMVCRTGSMISVYSVDVPVSTFNIAVKILLEQGIIGFIFALLTVSTVMVGLFENNRPLFYGLLSLLIFSMFSYPFELLPYNVILAIIVAWNESTSGKLITEFGAIRYLLPVCVCAAASWYMGALIGKCYKADNLLKNSVGKSIAELQEITNSIVNLESDNATFLFDYGTMLRKTGHYHDSNAILRMGTRCSADPMFYILTGNNYKDMKWYGLAEQSYNKAFSIMPNRLYPLYKLMLLYKDNGRKKEAIKMAKRVIDMNPKINSSATSDMKQEAMMLLVGEQNNK
jgi:O-antigen ligase